MTSEAWEDIGANRAAYYRLQTTNLPTGVEHRPHAKQERHVMLIEPAGVVNTGDAGGDMAAEAEWI